MATSPRPLAAGSAIAAVVAAAVAVVLVTGPLGGGHGPGIAAAAAATTDATTAPSVTVSGIGTVKGVPDTMTASFAVDVTRSDVQGALDAVAASAGTVVAALKHQGLASKDIATTDLTLYPSYDRNGHVDGYDAREEIVATISPLKTAGTVLSRTTASAGSAGRLDGFSLSIADDSSLLAQARAEAFSNAKDKAQQYAELSGLTLGRVLSVSETVAAASPERFSQDELAAGSAAALPASVPVQAGQQDEQVTVTVKWELG